MGFPVIRIRVFWGSKMGSPYFGKLPYIPYYNLVGSILFSNPYIAPIYYHIVLVRLPPQSQCEGFSKQAAYIVPVK